MALPTLAQGSHWAMLPTEKTTIRSSAASSAELMFRLVAMRTRACDNKFLDVSRNGTWTARINPTSHKPDNLSSCPSAQVLC